MNFVHFLDMLQNVNISLPVKGLCYVSPLILKDECLRNIDIL